MERTLFLRIDGHRNKNFGTFNFAKVMHNQNFGQFIVGNEKLLNFFRIQLLEY